MLVSSYRRQWRTHRKVAKLVSRIRKIELDIDIQQCYISYRTRQTKNEMSVCAVQRDKDVRRAAAAGLLF